MEIDAEVIDFLKRMQEHFDREEVQIAVLTAIAAEECVSRGYPQAIESLTETLIDVIHHERDRQAAESN